MLTPIRHHEIESFLRVCLPSPPGHLPHGSSARSVPGLLNLSLLPACSAAYLPKREKTFIQHVMPIGFPLFVSRALLARPTPHALTAQPPMPSLSNLLLQRATNNWTDNTVTTARITWQIQRFIHMETKSTDSGSNRPLNCQRTITSMHGINLNP